MKYLTLLFLISCNSEVSTKRPYRLYRPDIGGIHCMHRGINNVLSDCVDYHGEPLSDIYNATNYTKED